MGYVTALVQDTTLGGARAQTTGDGWLASPVENTSAADAGATITAAAIAGGLWTHSGHTASRTDTTDTGTLIAAAFPNMDIGDNLVFMVASLAGFTIVVAGGVGVTASGNLTVPANGAKFMLLTKTGAATFNLKGL